MAKVLGIHELELNAGTTPEEFERFITEEFQQMPGYPGTRFIVMRGVRGRRVDQYLLVFEFDSLETFQHIIPRENEFSEDYRTFLASDAVAKVLERWRQIATIPDPHYTDYVTLVTVG